VIRLKDVRAPRDEADARHLRTLAGVMMQHHVKLPWWDLRGLLRTYVHARALARRSLEGFRP
jgi:hypothetical protein